MASGDKVVVRLAGVTYAATVAADGTDFTATVATPVRFGGVQAYVADAAGNQSATKTQTFQLAAVSTEVDTGPNGPADFPPSYGIGVNS